MEGSDTRLSAAAKHVVSNSLTEVVPALPSLVAAPTPGKGPTTIGSELCNFRALVNGVRDRDPRYIQSFVPYTRYDKFFPPDDPDESFTPPAVGFEPDESMHRSIWDPGGSFGFDSDESMFGSIWAFDQLLYARGVKPHPMWFALNPSSNSGKYKCCCTIQLPHMQLDPYQQAVSIVQGYQNICHEQKSKVLPNFAKEFPKAADEVPFLVTLCQVLNYLWWHGFTAPNPWEIARLHSENALSPWLAADARWDMLPGSVICQAIVERSRHDLYEFLASGFSAAKSSYLSAALCKKYPMLADCIHHINPTNGTSKFHQMFAAAGLDAVQQRYLDEASTLVLQKPSEDFHTYTTWCVQFFFESFCIGKVYSSYRAVEMEVNGLRPEHSHVGMHILSDYHFVDWIPPSLPAFSSSFRFSFVRLLPTKARSDRPPGTLCTPCDPVLAWSPSGVQAGERVIPSDCSTSTIQEQASELVPSPDSLVPVNSASTVETPEQDTTSLTYQVTSPCDPIIVETIEEEDIGLSASASSSGGPGRLTQLVDRDQAACGSIEWYKNIYTCQSWKRDSEQTTWDEV